MALRQVEIVIPESSVNQLKSALAELDYIDLTVQAANESQALVRILVATVSTETLLDHLERNFSLGSGFRMTLLPVEGTIPRKDTQRDKAVVRGRSKQSYRINRTELLSDLDSGIHLNRIFVATVLLSAIVAAIGLLRNDVAIIIGAMVIAPLLTPNMALALGATLGDSALIRKSLKTNLVGVGMTLIFACLLGFTMSPDPSVPAIQSRTNVGIGDLVLAMAAGSAGVLSFTTGVSAGLVGVMVAVALMPPLVVSGMLLGAQQYDLALGAGVLVAANVICVNLCGVLTFLLQGVRPNTWGKSSKAKQSTRVAIAIWGTLFLLLIVLLGISWRGE